MCRSRGHLQREDERQGESTDQVQNDDQASERLCTSHVVHGYTLALLLLRISLRVNVIMCTRSSGYWILGADA